MTDLMSAIQRKRLEAIYGDEPYDSECVQFMPRYPPSRDEEIDEEDEEARYEYRQLAD
jgi:hypothetical protein